MCELYLTLLGLGQNTYDAAGFTVINRKTFFEKISKYTTDVGEKEMKHNNHAIMWAKTPNRSGYLYR